MARLVSESGEQPVDLGAPVGTDRLSGDLLLARVCTYLQTAIARMMVRADPQEYLALARLACEGGEDVEQAPVCRSVLALLDRFDRYLASNPPELAGDHPGARFPGMHLVVTASIVALTPDVPLPQDVEVERVGAREAG
jgi:hypothetical protein